MPRGTGRRANAPGAMPPLTARIRTIHKASGESYGASSIHAELEEAGVGVAFRAVGPRRPGPQLPDDPRQPFAVVHPRQDPHVGRKRRLHLRPLRPRRFRSFGHDRARPIYFGQIRRVSMASGHRGQGLETFALNRPRNEGSSSSAQRSIRWTQARATCCVGTSPAVFALRFATARGTCCGSEGLACGPARLHAIASIDGRRRTPRTDAEQARERCVASSSAEPAVCWGASHKAMAAWFARPSRRLRSLSGPRGASEVITCPRAQPTRML